jgi:hypothetical protein
MKVYLTPRFPVSSSIPDLTEAETNLRVYCLSWHINFHKKSCSSREKRYPNLNLRRLWQQISQVLVKKAYSGTHFVHHFSTWGVLLFWNKRRQFENSDHNDDGKSYAWWTTLHVLLMMKFKTNMTKSYWTILFSPCFRYSFISYQGCLAWRRQKRDDCKRQGSHVLLFNHTSSWNCCYIRQVTVSTTTQRFCEEW